jgi:uncharacterized membrane protein YhaH (DUF805 family)
MKRYDRPRMVAFCFLPLLNTLGLLLFGLEQATRGRDGAAATVPVAVVLAALSLLLGLWAAVKRGRDLDWPAPLTLLAFWVSLGLGPVVLVLLGWLVFAPAKPGADRFGPPAPRPGFGTWLGCVWVLAFPWLALKVAATVM